MLKRDEHQHCGGYWSFPGGKVEAGERSQQAAMRELKEETGLGARSWQYIGESSFSYSDRLLNFFLFSCVCENLSQLKTESLHAWVAIDRLPDYPMPEANAPLIAMLIEAANANGL